jgi:predicted helicase
VPYRRHHEDWSEHAEDALLKQQPPVLKIDLQDLENSQIDWAKYLPSKPPTLKPRKHLRPPQTSAKAKVGLGFQSSDRGKLIMACGTCKTFTSLKIAEEIAGKSKLVLFLVHSLNLLSQTFNEWTQESGLPLHSFAVCSDAEVGKKRDKSNEDIVETFAHELRYPATTDAKRLAIEVATMKRKRHTDEEIIKKLWEAAGLIAGGKAAEIAARRIGVSVPTHHRWKEQFGGADHNTVKRLRELEKENGRLKKLVADQALDNAMLKELVEGKW